MLMLYRLDEKIMDAWTQENPLGLEEELLTMKAYAPYHLLFAISMVFAKCNNQTNVPSPSECLKVASENNLVDSIINIAANCLNSAISAEKNNCEQNNRSFIPQNWVKTRVAMQVLCLLFRIIFLSSQQ